MRLVTVGYIGNIRAAVGAARVPQSMQHEVAVVAGLPSRPMRLCNRRADATRRREIEWRRAHGTQLAGWYAMGVDREDMISTVEGELVGEDALGARMAAQPKVRVLGHVDDRRRVGRRCHGLDELPEAPGRAWRVGERRWGERR